MLGDPVKILSGTELKYRQKQLKIKALTKVNNKLITLCLKIKIK